MSPAKIGMIGLAVMGRSLALNIESHGFPVAVWDRDPPIVGDFINHAAKGRQVIGAGSPKELVESLESPRKIVMMVKAGDPVDWTIEQIKPYLKAGDIIVDGGNSHFLDTRRRYEALKTAGIHFIGSGVSGGEEGALRGPSLMPGGDREAYEQIRPLWEAIAAKVDDGPCVTYVGADGAGHFVKMVHNGIEYGDLQLIAEAYDILHTALDLKADELASLFDRWNQGVLNSYLIEITAQVFKVQDPETGQPLVDRILDVAGQKGTGIWTSHLSLDLGVAVPTINAAIEARVLSGLKSERAIASRRLSGPAHVRYDGPAESLIVAVHDALYASKICSYAQGMALIRKAAQAYRWDINLGEISRIWKGGCIIRAQFLDKIKQAYQRRADLPNLLLDPEFKTWVIEAQPRWRQAVTTAQSLGIPCLALSASLSYFDSYRRERLPQNLTQAQRDFFGAHMYERIDKPGQGPFHTNWSPARIDR
ncbi:MAG: NADP-dependent phosphogluconate dehydrogenase [Acidobacteria bacterium]|nr:NADP-dependent phosphogluconate dehydrogenase [Acidobacteriota bacterium]MBI3658520.1 NADP-dependent phosphogluconate dehydrogenase [Acidobacteriota bacterium]